MAQEMVGATVEELEELARTLTGAAHTLDGLRDTVTGRVRSVRWDGPDGHRLRGEWDQRLRPSLDGVAAALRPAHDHVRAQAQQQREASGADSGGRVGPGSAWAVPALVVGAFGSLRALSDVAETFRTLTNPAATVGRYTNAWRKAIAVGGDVMRYKRSPVLQWLSHQDWMKAAGEAGRPFAAVSKVGTVLDMGDHAVHLADDLSKGDYRAFAFEGLHTTADALKSKPTPVSYLGGVALETWTEVFEEGEMPRWDEPLPNPFSGNNWRDIYAPTGSEVLGRLKKIFL